MTDKKCVVIVVLLLIIAVMGNLLFSKRESKELTMPIIDTVPFYMPVPVDSVVIRYEVVKLPIAERDTIHSTDTIIVQETDSVYISLPITQKIYEDSLYTAYVSGYNPKLDSINIYNKVMPKPAEYKWELNGELGYDMSTTSAPYIDIEIGYRLSKRININAHAGYNLEKNNPTPYLGVGITYNIKKW